MRSFKYALFFFIEMRSAKYKVYGANYAMFGYIVYNWYNHRFLFAYTPIHGILPKARGKVHHLHNIQKYTSTTFRNIVTLHMHISCI